MNTLLTIAAWVLMLCVVAAATAAIAALIGAALAAAFCHVLERKDHR